MHCIRVPENLQMKLFQALRWEEYHWRGRCVDLESMRRGSTGSTLCPIWFLPWNRNRRPKRQT